MKIKTKLILLLAILLTVAGIFVAPHKSLADSASATSAQDITDCLNSMHFVNIAEIDCSVGNNVIKFYDVDPTDGGPCPHSGFNNCSFHMNYAQQGNFFCSGGNVQHSTPGFASSQYYDLGVTVQGSGPLTVRDAGSSEKLIFNQGFADSTTGQCSYPKGKNKDDLPNVTASGSKTSNINVLMQFSSDGSTLDPLDAVANSNNSLSTQFSLVGQYTYNNSTVAYVTGYRPGSCNGQIVMANTTNARANQYYLDSKNQDLSGYPALLDFLNSQGSHGCSISAAEFGFGGTFVVSGTPPTSSTIANAGAAGTATGSLGAANNCDQSSFGFGWLFCSMLSAIDDTFNKIDAIIQQQLNFDVNQNLTPNVHLAWNTIRDISSVFLIVIMLIMVVSQAFGGGPFDAYTVRKVLPKLVIAVIMAQLSWQVLIWVIGLANDAGKGIADLLFFPFGGSAHMTLEQLVGKLGAGAPAGTLTAGLFAGILVYLLNPFGVLLFGFAAIMAVVTAVATLLFRTMLIIGGVVFAPIFFMAWVLPNTQKYWKFWTDNFIKALFLFPIIISIIAIGRIFAWIVGNSNGSHGLFDAIAVLVGYFGPYFLLPKTFKWGGGLMRMSADGINKAMNKVGEGPRKYLNARKEELNTHRQGKSAERVREDPRQLGSLLRMDPFRSGKWDPAYLLGGDNAERRRARLAGYVTKGRQHSGEVVGNIKTLLDAETQNMERGEAIRHVLGSVEDENGNPTWDRNLSAFRNLSGEERYARMQKLMQLQAGAQLTHVRDYLFSTGEAGIQEWNTFVNGDNGQNYGALKGVSPHLANSFDTTVHLQADGTPELDDNNVPVRIRWADLRQNELDAHLRAADRERFVSRSDGELATMADDGWERFNAVDTAEAHRRALDIFNLPSTRGSLSSAGRRLAGEAGAVEGTADQGTGGAGQVPAPAAPGQVVGTTPQGIPILQGNQQAGNQGPGNIQPGNIEVGIDHNVLASAVARGVRNALQHEVLRVRHEDNGGGGPAPTPPENGEGH